MAKIYTPSEFLKEKKLREIPVEFLAKFKEALSNHLPAKPDNDPESNYEDNVKALLEDTFYIIFSCSTHRDEKAFGKERYALKRRSQP